MQSFLGWFLIMRYFKELPLILCAIESFVSEVLSVTIAGEILELIL